VQSLGLVDSGQLAAYWHIDGLSGLGEARNVDSLAEDESVAGTTEVEHTWKSVRSYKVYELRIILTCTFALLDVVTFLHSDFAGTDFVHADTDEAHQANIRVVRLNEDDSSVKG